MRLWAGRVDLEPVAEAEQALGALALPDQRVERRQQGPRVDPARQARLRVEIGRLRPALDRDRQQLAAPRPARRCAPARRRRRGGNSRAGRARWRRPAHGRHAAAARAARPRRIGRRGVEHGSRQHALRQVVDPLEAAPRGRGDQAGPEQELQRRLAVAPAPPAALARGRPRPDRPAASGPACPDLGAARRRQSRAARARTWRAAVDALAGARRAPCASAAAAAGAPAAARPRDPSTRTAAPPAGIGELVEQRRADRGRGARTAAGSGSGRPR